MSVLKWKETYICSMNVKILYRGAWIAEGMCGTHAPFPADTTRHGQSAGGTHPTGMHSCFNNVLDKNTD